VKRERERKSRKEGRDWLVLQLSLSLFPSWIDDNEVMSSDLMMGGIETKREEKSLSTDQQHPPHHSVDPMYVFRITERSAGAGSVLYLIL
jgi:hypothetical protein